MSRCRGHRPIPGSRKRGDSAERGLGLFEVIAATLIASLAVLGLAYSLGIGRGLIDRYEAARVAMGEAQRVVDSLAVQPPGSLVSSGEPLVLSGSTVGSIAWTIDPCVDDPADGIGGADADNNTCDMKRITVLVSWNLGGSSDNLGLTRLVLAK